MAHLRNLFKPLTARLQSRLTQKLVLWIFASFITIEGLILVPSVIKRERELLLELKDVSSGKVDWIFETYPNASPEELLFRLQEVEQSNSAIQGGTLYRANGEEVGTFGEPPQLPFSEFQRSDSRSPRRSGSHYDDIVQMEETEDYAVVIRHDASRIKPELNIYIIRIVGLIVLISAFLTVTVWIALEPLVITPIFRLRSDLIRAGEAISQDREPPRFYSASLKRQDELGDVIAAFKTMFFQISEAISDRKQAQAALQQSLQKVEAYSQALDRELEKGREIQKSFLPNELVQKPGWEIATYFKPARRVAGDFYDTFELADNRVGLVIGDVCDKGVGAALFMGLFRSLIRIFSGQTDLDGVALSNGEAQLLQQLANEVERGPGDRDQFSALNAVRLTNSFIVQNHSNLGMFATLFFGVLDPATGVLAYINGGHEPMIVLEASGKIRELLKSTGTLVGILPDTTFQIQQIQLQPGDILLGYTDGVPEARNSSGEFFTRDRLHSMVQQEVSSASTLLAQLSDRVAAHIGTANQFDDITLLAVRRHSREIEALSQSNFNQSDPLVSKPNEKSN